jgi:hypothetical protein
LQGDFEGADDIAAGYTTPDALLHPDFDAVLKTERRAGRTTSYPT